MDINFSITVKKIFLILLVPLLFIGAFIYIQSGRTKPVEKSGQIPLVEETPVVPEPTLFPVNGSYKITLSKNTVKSGEKFTANIGFTVDNRKIFGTDIVLYFDPQMLEADKNLILGEYFQSYPRQEINNEKGIIKVTAFGTDKSEAMDKAQVLAIVFRSKKPGTAKLAFDFAQRKTNLTTLVEEGTSRNILAQADPVQITIEP